MKSYRFHPRSMISAFVERGRGGSREGGRRLGGRRIRIASALRGLNFTIDTSALGSLIAQRFAEA